MDDLSEVPTEELQQRLATAEPESLSNVPTHVLQARLATVEGKPDWTLKDKPAPEEAQRRLSDFLDTHARAFRPWEEVAGNLAQHFPGVDPEQIKEPYRRAGQAASLDEARGITNLQAATGEGPDWWQRHAMPFGSITNAFQAQGQAEASKRFQAGTPQPGDYSTIASAEAEQAQDAQEGEGWGGTLKGGLAGAMRLGGEAMLGGAALRGLGLAGEGAGVTVPKLLSTQALKEAGKYTGKLALQTAVMPSLYLDQAVKSNMEAGRDPLHVAGLPRAFALGMTQNAVLGAVGKYTGKFFPYEGLPQAAGRVAVQGASGPFAQAATDVLTSAVGLDAGYGTIGDILHGKYGDALKHATVQAMTFAAFAAAHDSGGKPRPVDPMASFAQHLTEVAGKGVSPDEAAKAISAGHDALIKPYQEQQRQIEDAEIKRQAEDLLRQQGVKVDPEKLTKVHDELRQNGDLDDAMSDEKGQQSTLKSPLEIARSFLAAVDDDTYQGRPVTLLRHAKLLSEKLGIEVKPEDSTPAIIARIRKQFSIGEAKPPGLRDNPDLDAMFGDLHEAPPAKSPSGEALPAPRPDGPEAPGVPPEGAEAGAGVPQGTQGPEAGVAAPAEPGRGTSEPAGGAEGPDHPAGQPTSGQEPGAATRGQPAAPTKPPGSGAGVLKPLDEDAYAQYVQALRGKGHTPVGTIRALLEGNNTAAAKELVARAGDTPVFVSDAGAEDFVGRHLRTPQGDFIQLNRNRPLTVRELAHILAHEAAHVARGRAGRKLGYEAGLPEDQHGFEQSARRAAEAVSGLKAGEKPSAAEADELRAAYHRQSPEAGAEVLKAFQESFPGGRITPRGEFEAEVGGKTIYANHDAERNMVRIDFEKPTGGVPAELQPGSTEFAKSLLSFVQKLQGTGAGIEYRAIDTNRGLYRRPRAEVYGRMLERAGYQQVGGPGVDGGDLYAWKPAAEGSPPAAPAIEEAKPSRMTATDLHDKLQRGESVPGLTKKQQEDLKAHIVDGLSLEEVGKRRGVTREAVRVSTDKALQKLHGMIEEPPAGSVAERPEKGTALGELPNDWIQNPTAEKLSDAINDHIVERSRGNNPLTDAEAQRIVDLQDRLDSARPGSARQRKAIAEATAFLESVKEGEAPRPAPAARPAEPAPSSESAGVGFGANVPGTEHHAGPDTGGADAAAGRGGESGAVDLDVLGAALREKASGVQAMFKEGRMVGKELSGKMFPRTKEIDRVTNEKMGELAAANDYSSKLAARRKEEIGVGKNSTPEFRQLVGAVANEMRFRHAKAELLAQGDTEGAKNVKTFVGKPGSPLQTEADYQAGLTNPDVAKVIQGYKSKIAPELTEHFKTAEDIDPADDIPSLTQIPGLPFNAKALREGDPTDGAVFFGSGKAGNAANVKLARLGFAKKFTGSAEAYDIDFGRMIDNSYHKGYLSAAKHEYYRAAEEGGVGQKGKPGQKVEINGQPAVEIKDVFPQKWVVGSDGKPVQIKPTSWYIDARHEGEYRQMMKVDKLFEAGAITRAANKINTLSLVGLSEAAAHVKNLSTSLLESGVNPLDTFKHAAQVWKNDPVAKERLLDLARIGADKPAGAEVGALGSLLGEEGAKTLGKWDPTLWMGKFIDSMRHVMMLNLDKAYDRLVAAKKAPDTDAGRRDFINTSLGQYHRAGMNRWQQLAKDSGLAPFTVAATAFNLQGYRTALGGKSAAEPASVKADFQLRAAKLAKVATIVGATAVTNALLWGRWDGDDSTPLGSVKIGEWGGKTHYLGVSEFTGLTRGMKATGAMAVAEGNRGGKSFRTIGNDAAGDIVRGLTHPISGPGTEFLHTATTGRGHFDEPVAKRAGEDESQQAQNLLAAAKGANPLLKAYYSHKEGETPDALGTLNKSLGPFGIKSRTTRSHAESLALELSHSRMPEDPDAASVEKSRQKRTIRDSLAPGDTEPLRAAVRAGDLSSSEALSILNDSRLSPIQRAVQHLPLKDAVRVWEVAKEDERKQLRPMLATKYLSAARGKSAKEQQAAKALWDRIKP